MARSAAWGWGVGGTCTPSIEQIVNCGCEFFLTVIVAAGVALEADPADFDPAAELLGFLLDEFRIRVRVERHDAAGRVPFSSPVRNLMI